MFDRVEPETRLFLKKIMNTLFIGLFWMFAQVIFGIFLEFGFIQNGFSITNMIYYTLLLASLAWLIYYMYKLWNK
jgi:hypothetical protein